MNTFKLVMENREKIRDIVETNRFTNPRLFGSVARGSDTEYSDIDILVDPKENASYWKLAKIKRMLETLLGRKVDIAIDRSLIKEFRPHIEKNLIEI